MDLLKWTRKSSGPGREILARRLDDVEFVVVDLELTGLDARFDGILSIGAVKMSAGGRIELGSSFYRLVRPTAAFKPESVVVHEIVPSEVTDSPDIAAVLPEFLDYCGDNVLVGYCLEIDLAFIRREIRNQGRSFENRGVDILPLFEHLLDKGVWDGPALLPDGSLLQDLAGRLDVPCGKTHHALVDAFVTAQLFQRMLPELKGRGVGTLEDLLRIGNPGMARRHSSRAQAMSNF